MFPPWLVLLSTLIHILPALGTAESDTVAQLRLGPTALDRLKTLGQDSDFVFDFFNPPGGVTMGGAGHTVAATSASFPAVIGNGVAMTVGFLAGCALNSPHTHPRATEINFSVNGTLRTGTLQENGARFVVNELPPGSVTIFPMGAIHFEMNDGCEPAMFVSAFNSEDPGVLQLAQRFYGLPVDVIQATLGGLGVEEVEGLADKIPDNIAYGTDACLQRCGLVRPPTQPTAQQQPRVSGNALPTGASAPAPSSTGNSTVTNSTVTNSTVTNSTVAASPANRNGTAPVNGNSTSTRV
ncbi:RmlC-like cupin domain-containing protein [Mycena amicta]|nr:RmlC-like cupin domain-containing protein [Mycena amicta]